jgi:hypothetical protein
VLKRVLDFLKPLLVVLYLRMSSDQQNPRSPQQQCETIESTIRRLGYPWTVVRCYTDEAISGQYVRGCQAEERPEHARPPALTRRWRLQHGVRAGGRSANYHTESLAV